jgi:hypothetical protein
MPSGAYGQEKSFLDYQGAVQHFNLHWRRFLSATQGEIVQAVIDRTVRFGVTERRIPTKWFYEGHSASDTGDYAGCAPILPVSRQAFSVALRDLQRLGILTVRDSVYRVNFDVNAMQLALDERVQARVTRENYRGGILSTVEGMLEWASVLIEKWLQNLWGGHNKSGQDITDCCQPYTLTPNKTYVFTSDKSSVNGVRGKTFRERVKDYLMGNAKASEILSAIQTQVDAARNRVADKRRKRRTLADECALFEQAWLRGQKGEGRFANRIVGADRRLLKDQIIKPAANSSLDLEKLAEWATEHWDAIGAQYFAKAKSYPEYPAFRWFVKCFATYLTAYEQRDYLDESGTRNTTQLLKRAKQADKLDEQTEQTLAAAKREIDMLKAELRDAHKRVAKAAPIDDFDLELQSIVNAKPKRRRIKR